MDGREAFAADGAWRRGNVHTHSDRSDGALPAEAVCRRYREASYDFLCLSDHFLPDFGFPITDTRDHRTDGFTTLIGAEIHAPENSHGEIWHVLACGLPLDFAPPEAGERMEALAARARAAGAFLGIAHPQWSSLTIEDGRAMAVHAHAVEIWNTGSGLETARPDGTALLDALLNEGHRHLTAYATDDAHFRIDDAFGGWMMVRAARNEPDDILEAMQRGHYYSSQGPTIEAIEIIGETVRVRASMVRCIALVGRGSRARNQFDPAGITEVELPLAPFANDWFRVVVTDAQGRHAWSNPIFP